MKFKVMLTSLCAAATLAAANPASAACLAPHPVCVAVGIGYVAALIFGLNEPKEIKPLQVEQDEAVIRQIVHDLRQIKNYTIRMGNFANYNPGYGSIIRRYESGKISGNLSLESMYSFSPKVFRDLDTLEEVIRKNVGDEVMTEMYGPRLADDGSINWQRYYLLATDAEVLYKNLFAIR